NSEDIEDPDVDVGNHHWDAEQRAAEWNDRDCQDRRDHRQTWRQPVVKSVHGRGREIFFQQKLRSIGDRLKKAGRADTIRAEAVLNERADATLRVNRVGNHRQNHNENHSDDFQKRRADKKIIHLSILRYRPAGRLSSAFSMSLASGSIGGRGDSSSFVTFTPKSPILFKVNPASSGISALICRKTSSIV